MTDYRCLTPGCTRPAKNTLGIRLRRPDTSAIWAPGRLARLCDHCATAGGDLTIDFRPNERRELLITVLTPSGSTSRLIPLVK